ncbi:MAG: ABC transporter ATP-binding protein [Lentimicrobiaceae bacterium]|nr:ABC transporter ATP-binding protein [Lentimicrobiaceae bacterium]
MKVILKNIAKKYESQWVFKNINVEICSEQKYAILGTNGSGKSTLLRIISSYMLPTLGEVIYHSDNSIIAHDQVHKYVNYAAPYINFVEEFSVKEFLRFHKQFKPFVNGYGIDEVLDEMQLKNQADKKIAHLSSGMKQRLRLAVAFLTESKLILLDEPITNLDSDAIAWYKYMINTYTKNKTLLVSSNSVEPEYEFCDYIISLSH